MQRNKRIIIISISIAALLNIANERQSRASSGTVPAASRPQASQEYECKLIFHRDIPVGLSAGTPEYPKLVEIQSVRFENVYGNAWGVTARVGWLPVTEAPWRLTIELLDDSGRVLRNSRDNPAMLTCKAGNRRETDMRYAELNLGAMEDQGRKHAAKLRVRLEPLKEPAVDTDSSRTLEVALVDLDSGAPIPDAVVVVRNFRLQDAFRQWDKTLYCADSQGRCNIRFASDDLVSFEIEAQQKDYCTIHKAWSNSGSWPVDRGPLINLPQRHVLEMVRATSLGGIVQDTRGNAIEGAEVRFTAYSDEPSGIMGVNRTIQTDADGCWRVDGVYLASDTVTVGLRHPEYGGDNGSDRRIVGEALLNARAFKHVETLEKGLTITGRVLNDRGDAVPDAAVMMVSRSFNPLHVLTDVSGAFQFVCSADESVYREAPALVAEAPGYASALLPIEIQPNPKPLEFHLTHGRNIACRVVDADGQPVAGAWTVADTLPGDLYYPVWLEDTDERGGFQIPNMPQSDISLAVGKPGYLTTRDYMVAASEKELVVTLKRALHVTGTVTDATSGKTIPNFEIAAVITAGGRTRNTSPVAFVEGAYHVSCDETQPETLRFQASAVGYEPAVSQEIKVDQAEHVINFKLSRSASFDEATAGRPREQIHPSGPRRITGTVRDEEGNPVPDAVVRTHPSISNTLETITNAKGVFTFKSRRIWGSPGRSFEERTTYLAVRQRQRNLAAAVVLDDSTDTPDITLTPGVILSGRVVDVERKGIPSAQLSLTFWVSGSGYGIREAAGIDEEGRYEIRAVPTGQKYSVTAQAEGYGKRYVQVDTSNTASGKIELEPLVLSVANLSASGVVVDYFDQPVSGIRIYAHGNGQPSRETFTDANGKFTIENVCPGTVSIQANSKVGAPQRLHGRTQARSGDTNIRIVVDQMDERGRPVPPQPPSLLGSPLPGFEDVTVKLSPADAKGKMLLLCFFDMNQRPSRHCISQLAQQAKTLEEKGAVIVGVQASNIEASKFAEWVKKSDIPFSTGMVQGDAEKTRFAWGVRSLPWPILTDSTHIVRAEGFPLTELDDKIKAMDQ